ncbi:MAG: ATP-binding protein [Adlercreutzia caecimuris]|jgi:predicted AAA+ superfamily ATPase|uniref:ATP-binding protein n=1 Tax=Adlercreutzia caecimuris TaxID=671266 RepID=UPI00242EE807|nr:ATP-binding protein [Adlercreutzia caecimuris]MCI9207493.1 ATP-binding protein [Adlercreutzia caecimuris]
MVDTGRNLFPRPTYDALLDSYLDTAPIKVLSGVRRCGKSSLLFMLANRLREKGVPESNILYKKLDSFDVPLEPTSAWLDDLLRHALAARDHARPFYVFLDEVQEVPSWEKVVRRLHTEPATDIFLTGSNAFLLSSDLATYLSGRYIEIPVWPLSFPEYLEFSQATDSGSGDLTRENLFARYVRYGGMPGLFDRASFEEEFVMKELTAIRDTVILNDVAKRFELRDIDLLEKLVRYVYSTSGNLFSSRKIADTLTSMGRKTSSATVDSYLSALRRAFLVLRCEQEGIAGKTVLQPLQKLYAPDTGLRNREVGFASRDIGYQLESIVFCELKRRGYEVRVGAGAAGEVDFVASRRSERLYVQVSSSIVEGQTFERELSSLEAIRDSFPKIVLTRDSLLWGTTATGIEVTSLIDWLCSEGA